VAALGLTSGAQAAVFYEPFDYPTGNLGLNTNPSVSQQWFSTATSGADDRVQVAATSLTAPAGLPAPVGGSSTFGGAGRTDRIFLGANRTSGTVYYSLLMQVPDLANTLAGGSTIFGFNNTAQTLANHDTAGQPTAISGRLILRPVGDVVNDQYNIGIHKSAGTTGQFVFDTTTFGATDTVFLVGRYTYNTGSTTDDVFDLWINPSPATFADDSLIPAPTISETAGTDTGTIATIILRQTSAVVSESLIFDEIRVDTTWAHATSNLIPEPSSLGLAIGAGTMLLRRRARKS
jgi:hypothetical protein